MSRQVLLIHYYFPPIHSVGCKRNLAFAKEWVQWSDNVQVLTTSNRDILPSDTSLSYDEFDIVALPTYDHRTMRGQQSAVHYTESSKGSVVGRLATKTIHTYPINLWLGEGGRRYIKAGIRAGSAFLTKHPNAIIYSSFRPYADHAIAHELRRRFPHTTWIADFRDPDIDPMYQLYLHRGWQQQFNRKMLRRADIVTTVSDGVTHNLKTYHNNVHTVMNGVTFRPKQTKYDTFTISYTGSLYGEYRDPQPLFKAVKSIADKYDINIVYAGKDGQQFTDIAKAEGIDHRIINRGMVSSEEAQTIQSGSHLNLLLTTSTQGYSGVLTGKLFEYIGAATPILAIIKGEKDAELSRLFETYNLGYLHTAQETNIANSLRQAMQNPTIPKIAALKKAFSWQSRLRDLLCKTL